MAIDAKLRKLEPSTWQQLLVKIVLRKTHLKIQKTPTRPLKLDFRLKNISGNIRDIEKKNYFEALLTAFFIPWKTQF